MELINGGLAVDDRGTVSFVNDFNFEGVKRFYVVENHERGFIRAWHGHKQEGKYVYVSKGAAIIGVFSMDTEERPERYVLSASKPQVLYIPRGNYNGFKTLTDDTQVIFFSTSTTEDSKDDDYRFTTDKAHITGRIGYKFWEVEQR